MSTLPPTTLTALLGIRLGGVELSGVLQRIVDIAKDAVAGVDEVSITLVRADKPFTAAYTGQLALDADEMQYERGYGPCIDAGTTGTLLRVDDMRVEKRWPDYAATVVPRGVLSSLSVPLPLQTDTVGALNCYSRTEQAFHDEQSAIAVELAGYIAVAVGNAVSHVANAQLAEQMAEAMASRAVIEQAKGVILRDQRCTSE